MLYVVPFGVNGGAESVMRIKAYKLACLSSDHVLVLSFPGSCHGVLSRSVCMSVHCPARFLYLQVQGHESRGTGAFVYAIPYRLLSRSLHFFELMPVIQLVLIALLTFAD